MILRNSAFDSITNLVSQPPKCLTAGQGSLSRTRAAIDTGGLFREMVFPTNTNSSAMVNASATIGFTAPAGKFDGCLRNVL